MVVPFVLFIGSLVALFATVSVPELSDFILVAGPAAFASLYLFLRAVAQKSLSPEDAAALRHDIVVDGSNVMHWKDETPRLATLNEVLSFLQVRGYNPGYREGKLWMELDHPFHIPPSPRPDSPL